MKRDARLDGLISARKMRATLAMTLLRAERDKLQQAVAERVAAETKLQAARALHHSERARGFVHGGDSAWRLQQRVLELQRLAARELECGQLLGQAESAVAEAKARAQAALVRYRRAHDKVEALERHRAGLQAEARRADWRIEERESEELLTHRQGQEHA